MQSANSGKTTSMASGCIAANIPFSVCRREPSAPSTPQYRHLQFRNGMPHRLRLGVLPLSCASGTPIPGENASFSLTREFDPDIPIEEAQTPPSSWYTDPSFYSLELARVFYRGWQAVGIHTQTHIFISFFITTFFFTPMCILNRGALFHGI